MRILGWRIFGGRYGRPALCAVALIAGAVLAHADGDTAAAPAPDDARLAGDYFVGASVFLFQRTVLTAFAPAETPDSDLDAGAIVWAAETAHDEAGAVAFDAITAWLTAADLKSPVAGSKDGPPLFAPERLRRLACLTYGADPVGQGELAEHGALSSDDRQQCVAQFKRAQAQWNGGLLAYRRRPGAGRLSGAADLHLYFAPTMDDADQVIADAMKQNGLFQALTDGINDDLVMPHPVTALLTQCGEARAFYNPDRGEAVLCYETLGALLQAAPQ
jgi:hypothetical protein